MTAHPSVQPPYKLPKELHFFDRYWYTSFDQSMAASYHRCFPRPSGAIAGEWTPRYINDYWTIPLLRTVAPEARLLVMLRDPVERYISGVGHDLARGAPLSAIVASEAFTRGCYASQLRRVLQHFPLSQLLVLQYERCVLTPAEELRRTFEWLGVEPLTDAPPALSRVINQTRHPKPVLSDRLRSALVQAYKDDVDELRSMFDEIDVDHWPNFSLSANRPTVRVAGGSSSSK